MSDTNDARFAALKQLAENELPPKAGPSKLCDDQVLGDDEDEGSGQESSVGEEEDEEGENSGGDGLDSEGFSEPAGGKVVKPITPEALAAFNAAQERTGVIYISRIPPGMRPTKVRHLMSAFGEVGRVYLQQEDAKRAYLRKKFTATKKAHFTEGWVEFADKKVARSVAAMLNAQPIGGKKGSRWRDDVWTMKYLPRFKWNMLTEAIAHESAERTARLRVELEQSRKEQKEYLHNVELARVLDKRAKRKRESGKGEDMSEESQLGAPLKKTKLHGHSSADRQKSEGRRKQRTDNGTDFEKAEQLENVLGNIF